LYAVYGFLLDTRRIKVLDLAVTSEFFDVERDTP
jgi:hypothetical protein